MMDDAQTAFAAQYPTFGFDLDMMKVSCHSLMLPDPLGGVYGMQKSMWALFSTVLQRTAIIGWCTRLRAKYWLAHTFWADKHGWLILADLVITGLARVRNLVLVPYISWGQLGIA